MPRTNASIDAPSDSAEEGRWLADAHRALIAHRLPFAAISWLGIGLVVRSGLILQSKLALGPAIVSLALQGAVLGCAIAICRADPHAPRVVPVVRVTLGLLSLLAAGFYAYTGGNEEALAFAMGTLGIGSSLAFAWGWRAALGQLAVSVLAWLAAAPYLSSFATTTERGVEIAIGSFVSLAISEVAAHNFRASWRHERTRVLAVQSLAASHAAYRDLTENAPDLIYTHDLQGRFTYVNEGFAHYVGVAAADLIGRCGPDMVPPDPSNPDLRLAIARLAAGEAVAPLVFWVERPGGERRWLECIISGIRDPETGGVVGVRGIARDVTARHSAEEALRASEERLRRLSRHQAAIREEERKRIGFDLHDDVCQELVGIGILVESLRRQLAPQSPAADVGLARISRYVNEVGEHLRQLARDLRPMMLRDLGLEESLHALAEGITAAGMKVAAIFPTPIPRLHEDLEIGVYRIAQEALANAARHSGAGSVRLTLAAVGDTLQLEVTDDGRGFVPDDRRGSDTLGLVSMEERALALGGRLGLRSAPTQGTTLRLECPLVLRASASAA